MNVASNPDSESRPFRTAGRGVPHQIWTMILSKKEGLLLSTWPSTLSRTSTTCTWPVGRSRVARSLPHSFWIGKKWFLEEQSTRTASHTLEWTIFLQASIATTRTTTTTRPTATATSLQENGWGRPIDQPTDWLSKGVNVGSVRQKKRPISLFFLMVLFLILLTYSRLFRSHVQFDSRLHACLTFLVQFSKSPFCRECDTLWRASRAPIHRNWIQTQKNDPKSSLFDKEEVNRRHWRAVTSKAFEFQVSHITHHSAGTLLFPRKGRSLGVAHTVSETRHCLGQPAVLKMVSGRRYL